jgi:hypothetical protein
MLPISAQYPSQSSGRRQWSEKSHNQQTDSLANQFAQSKDLLFARVVTFRAASFPPKNRTARAFYGAGRPVDCMGLTKRWSLLR